MSAEQFTEKEWKFAQYVSAKCRREGLEFTPTQAAKLIRADLKLQAEDLIRDTGCVPPQ